MTLLLKSLIFDTYDGTILFNSNLIKNEGDVGSIFPSINFTNLQFPKRKLPKSAQAASLGTHPSGGARPLAHPSLSAGPSLQPAAHQRA